ncbi:MAG: family 78 glycoside hydrolase catalytic domain [Planctomycetes bacterium]|nr:family 78 glycoside hydrolase catalytic domain [Planctomycetota bacterium]
MRTLHTILIFAALVAGCTAVSEGEPKAAAGGGGAVPASLRCEYLTDPLGIGTLAPRLSWIIESPARGERQTAYRILVASGPETLARGEGDLWDSGKVASGETAQITYAGKPLASRARCHWKVRIWDKDGIASPWSSPALWTMGLLADEDWKASWIGLDGIRVRPAPASAEDLRRASWIWYPEEKPEASAPIETCRFRRAFPISAEREIRSATCALTADNSATLWVNGKEIGATGNFKQATVYDIGDALRAGENVIAVSASNAGDKPNPAGLIAAARIDAAGGDPILVLSDGEWRVLREEAPGWKAPGFDAAGWAKAQAIGPFGSAPWGEIEIQSAQLFLPPVPHVRKAFEAKGPIRRAMVYASALGLYELHINGRRVGRDWFTPGWTDYDIRVYYDTYDVTDLVRQGKNAIGALLADGWYSGYIGWGRKRDHFGDKPRLRVQLEIEYADGKRETIATDGSWRASTGPILEADFLMGETYDARLEIPGWDAPGFDDAGWFCVDVTEAIDAKVQAYPGVRVHCFAEIAPKGMATPAPGVHVFDMGRNFAGVVRLKVEAPRGTKVTLRFAERLNPDGTIYTTNLRGARATDTYVCGGRGVEVWQPRFTFHGFQYVELSGLPAPPGLDAVTGIAISSDTPVAGTFACSDETANTLYGNICWTQRANFIDIPTDCPQRDERLGWTGDAQIYIRTATYATDVSAFFTKWLVDLEDARLPDGAFPDVAPRRVAMGGGTAAWADAGTICPWTIHQVYGDARILEKHYDAMVGWVEYCRKNSEDLLRPAQGYGDWLSIKADTPKDVLATAYFAKSASIVARAAEVLGKTDDAKAYAKLFGEIRDAFNEAYVAGDARIKGDTQTVYVLALAFDLLPEAKRSLAVAHLVEDIEKRGWHLSTGFVGTKDLMTVLTRFGRTDVAYRLFHNDTFPSWGFSIAHGATSIWERWDGWTPEKGFQDPGMNSFAHYSFGAVGEWMAKTIGGIDTDGPGFERLRIRPEPGGRLTRAEVSYDSIHGRIATRWRLEGGDLRFDLTVPANVTALVWIPAASAAAVTEGGRSLDAADCIRFTGMEGGFAVCEVGSGTYRFVSRGAPLAGLAK